MTPPTANPKPPTTPTHSTEQRPTGPSVVLASMPFGPLLYPSLGLSLLKPRLVEAGIDVRVIYFTLRYGEEIGRPLYDRIAEPEPLYVPDLLGEWIFAGELEPGGGRDPDGYVDEVLRQGHPAHRVAPPLSAASQRRVLELRAGAGDFLDRAAAEILAHQPRLVGLTSLFFQQVASLALARRLKARAPDLFIVLGGANCEGPMGLEVLARFPAIDAIVSGEADQTIVPLVQRVLAGDGDRLGELPGVLVRGPGGRPMATRPAIVTDLDTLPHPDYSDYFAQFAATRFAARWNPRILFESSRGCWWGERQHCTFCGLNGATMAFRSKSQDRVLAELDDLNRRHPDCPIQVVDNILDMNYFKQLVPALAARRTRIDLFYETKSNLKKEQIASLRAAGIRTIQPGIESLSDEVLRIMRKGVTGLHNVQLLKWCAELGVTPLWNFLWGFPGEPEAEYARMAELVPLLTHLPPPSAMESIRLDRFSPNFNQAEQFGLTDVEPYPAYGHIYPFAPEAVRNLAYFFTFRYRRPQPVEVYTRSLTAALRRWQTAHPTSALFSVERDDQLWIWDTRPGARQPLHVLIGTARALYHACDGVVGERNLLAATAAPTAAARSALADLVAAGLVLASNDRYLALAIPLSASYSPPPAAVARFYAVAAGLGRDTRGGSTAVPPPDGRSPVRPARGRCRDGPARLNRSQFRLTDQGEMLIRR